MQIQIYLNSRFAKNIIDPVFNSSMSFGLVEPIICPKDHHMYVSIATMEIPNTFTNTSTLSFIVGTNLSTQHQSSATKCNILGKVTVMAPPKCYIFYQNYYQFKTRVFNSTIENIDVKLFDDQGNLLNLQGAHFSITIQVDFVKDILIDGNIQRDDHIAY